MHKLFKWSYEAAEPYARGALEHLTSAQPNWFIYPIFGWLRAAEVCFADTKAAQILQ